MNISMWFFLTVFFQSITIKIITTELYFVAYLIMRHGTKRNNIIAYTIITLGFTLVNVAYAVALYLFFGLGGACFVAAPVAVCLLTIKSLRRRYQYDLYFYARRNIQEMTA